MWSFTYPGVLIQGVIGQYKEIPNFLSFFWMGDCDNHLKRLMHYIWKYQSLRKVCLFWPWRHLVVEETILQELSSIQAVVAEVNWDCLWFMQQQHTLTLNIETDISHIIQNLYHFLRETLYAKTAELSYLLTSKCRNFQTSFQNSFLWLLFVVIMVIYLTPWVIYLYEYYLW